MSRVRRSGVAIRAAVVLAAFVAIFSTGQAVSWLTGTLTGTVTDAVTGAPVSGLTVLIYGSSGGAPVANPISGADGTFASPALAAGTYHARINGTALYEGQQYDHINCGYVCSGLGAPITVTDGVATAGVDFALRRLGSIAGVITDAGTGAPLSGITVTTEPTAKSAVSDAAGAYVITGVAAGSHFARTSVGAANYINELYDNLTCLGCLPINGTAIVVAPGAATGGINFALSPGGSISGSLTDGPTGTSAPGEVRVFDAGGRQVGASSLTANYTVNGLATGIYFAVALPYSGSLLSGKAFDGLSCPWGAFEGSLYVACTPTLATPIAVTAGAVTNGINFAFGTPANGTVTGTVTDAISHAPLGSVQVRLYSGIGYSKTPGNSLVDVSTNAAGVFTASVPPGTVYVSTFFAPGHEDMLWPNIPCPFNCFGFPTSGAPVVVTPGATTGGIDLALPPAGGISGTVTDETTGAGLGGEMSIYNSRGALQRTLSVAAGTGAYTVTNLVPGMYYAQTLRYYQTNYADELYDGTPCENCDPRIGTPIVVTAGNITSGINFALGPAGSIAGTVTDQATGQGLSGQVNIYTSAGVLYSTTFSDLGTGTYTATGLAPGTYYVRTVPQPPFAQQHGYLDEAWDDVECFRGECPPTAGTPIVVTAGAVRSGIDFALSRGASIAGTLSAGASVAVYSSSGRLLKTDGAGPYEVFGLPAGTYFVRTLTEDQIDQAFDSELCAPCYLTESVPIVLAAGEARTGVDFTLEGGGALSGRVLDAASGAGITGVAVAVYTATGALAKTTTTDRFSEYRVSGLRPGTYYVSAGSPAIPPPTFLDGPVTSLFLLDALYGGAPCQGCVQPPAPLPHVSLCPACVSGVTAGTPVTVEADATRTGVDIALASGGGTIGGSVASLQSGLPLEGVGVSIYNSSNQVVKSVATDVAGAYVVRGLAPGTYYARTIVSQATARLIDAAYGGTACAPCAVASTSAPITVSADAVTSGINFSLADGGSFAGFVTDAQTSAALRGLQVQAFTAAGVLVKGVYTNGFGGFDLGGLPPGTYYARTMTAGSAPGYVDQRYHGLPCTLHSCDVTAGTPIVISAGATTPAIDFTLDRNLIANGGFTSGLSGWAEFATPDLSYIVSNVTDGVYQFYRVAPPPGTANQAVAFQQSGAAIAAGQAVAAQFDLGNSSTIRKRIGILIQDSDFSDFFFCSFWLPPASPLRTYGIQTHTSKAWANATISFYAASIGSLGGFYQIDNATLQETPLDPTADTACIDPLAPAPSGGAPGPNLLVNGDFGTGAMAPWGTFGTITTQIAGGVLEFVKPTGVPPAGVLLQLTGQAMTASQILTATLQLGNSSGVTKRVTVLVHDSDFSDLAACTFWLTPGQPLSDYAIRTFTTKPWTNATFSVYPATVGAEQWIRLDNVALQRTPGAAVSGTECVEPASGAPANPGRGGPVVGLPPLVAAEGDASGWSAVSGSSAVVAAGAAGEPRVLRFADAIDLRQATEARLTFKSWLVSALNARAEIHVSIDGHEWITVGAVSGSDGWRDVDVDLSALLGQVVYVRFVFAPGAFVTGQDMWWVDAVRVLIR